MRQVLLIATFLSILFLCSTHTFAQTDFRCGTVIPHDYLESQKRAMPGYFGCEQINRVNRKISVLFQVIRDSVGGTGVTDANLEQSINRLNEIWAPTGISFEFCERRNLDNHQFNEFVQLTDGEDMEAMYYEPNVINVFISATVNTISQGDVAGYAYPPGGKDIVHVKKSSMQDPEFPVLIHEMGHFLGLLHTFETSTGAELADGSNCTSAGDLICDTEASPTNNPADFSGTNCNYIGMPAADAMGNFYVPPSKNFMSYSGCGCEFTKQQYNRMVEQYLQIRNYLW
ncbi:hypothetical protein G3O08_06035 [Cryomorpha ignava]|uniref:Peptidase M43 pregnancy-associated plasma-A domain-containing protein n=1 Tax=Cryomorpha ignava TaxID=101383 RepID=A0A7K3WN30_9FLAO|nr:M43 family zinc metalloprotease [Cryomorpha ignava]NEN23057.1 hypothetical protein [Cryomorpha ignava]